MKDIFAGSKSDDFTIPTRLLLASLEFDPNWTEVVMDRLEAGEADIRPVLYYLAASMQPARYIETGVRRGWSMACVAAGATDCHLIGFDKWIPIYGDSPNPGPAFVQAEIAKTGHTGEIELISGDTNETLAAYLDANPGLTFDLALVDGDHGYQGTVNDLTLIIPRLTAAGCLIIDDLDGSEVSRAWLDVLARNPHLSHAQDGIVGIVRNVGVA